jgi:hypothetical protein
MNSPESVSHLLQRFNSPYFFLFPNIMSNHNLTKLDLLPQNGGMVNTGTVYQPNAHRREWNLDYLKIDEVCFDGFVYFMSVGFRYVDARHRRSLIDSFSGISRRSLTFADRQKLADCCQWQPCYFAVLYLT